MITFCRLAENIHQLKHDWDDETIYQEARRLLIAEMQKVTYREFLPAILSENLVFHPEGFLRTPVEGTQYRPDVNPAISNAFATAAYRFGHSMIQGLVQAFNPKDGQMSLQYNLGPNFFNDTNYVKDNGWGMENILKGLTVQAAAKFDAGVTDQVQ